ncbi:MAG: PhzF family phenazine biosynthesis protein, partial [Flavobacteriaceae bacterium]|nr:PhzF family phenazine biosynthesis protein [Flavobacteriaceae bacterium]
MKIKLYQIDAFTNQVFGGNPAAVCILNEWISETFMQQIAAENNLAETAFAVKNDNFYEIRWFTPKVEVNLCGHATLATAHVLFKYYEFDRNQLNFYSYLSGILSVSKDNELLTLDFPTDIISKIETPAVLIESLGKKPIETWKGKTDFMLIYENQETIGSLKPNFQLLESVGGRGVIVTSKGKEVDFVSRFFGPQVGINEDPVTGSAHTTLIPYWSKVLGKTSLTAIQLSARKGHLFCEYLTDRVKISGNAVTYL